MKKKKTKKKKKEVMKWGDERHRHLFMKDGRN